MLIDEATLPKKFKDKLKFKDLHDRGDRTGTSKIRNKVFDFGKLNKKN